MYGQQHEIYCFELINFCEGQRICKANEYFEAGEGAYEFGNSIFSSVLGYLHVKESPEEEVK